MYPNQDCGLSAASTLVSSLPSSIRSDMAMKLGDKRIVDDSGTYFTAKKNGFSGKKIILKNACSFRFCFLLVVPVELCLTASLVKIHFYLVILRCSSHVLIQIPCWIVLVYL